MRVGIGFDSNIITGAPPDKDFGGRAVCSIDPAARTTNFARVAYGHRDDADNMLVANNKIYVKCQRKTKSLISSIDGYDLFAETEIWAWDAHIDSKGVPGSTASLSDVNTPYEVFIIGNYDSSRVKVSNHGEALEDKSFGSFNKITCRSSDEEVGLDELSLPRQEQSSTRAPKGLFQRLF